MKCVILQPSYIPWRGYFHQIYKADIFVFYDDVQYDQGGWRNRNRIKTPNGSQWLTIPVLTKNVLQNRIPIKEIYINWEQKWNVKHWRTLQQFYSKAPYFQQYAPVLEEFYNRHPQLLADFTIDLTIALAKELGIDKTRFIRSSELKIAEEDKTSRLVNILEAVGANHLVCGPSVKNYLREDQFLAERMSIEYMVYTYPEYEQFYPPFDPNVSILDLLFMTGPHAHQYIW